MQTLLFICFLFTLPLVYGVDSLDFEMYGIKENKMLGPDKAARIYALGKLDGEKEPLILVHGINADPGHMMSIARRFKFSQYQVYILAYSDIKKRTSLSGDDFAQEILNLKDEVLGSGRNLTIIAHSLGGLVARRALVTLTPNIKEFGTIRFFSIDTPWHGFQGPADNFMVDLLRVFIPDGYEDMRGRSDFFKNVTMPSQVELYLAFAENGKQASDYTELKKLVPELVKFYLKNIPVKGNAMLMNYLFALRASVQFAGFEKDILALENITSQSVLETLALHFPKFPGDHETVIEEGPYLDYLEKMLGF